MPMLYTIKIKFDIDINNDELFETHMRTYDWGNKRRGKRKGGGGILF
jgi:hypothetical protein